MTTVWLPYETREEAFRRIGVPPAGITVDIYNGDDTYPDSIREVEFYVVPYMAGPEVLGRRAEMSSLKVVQTLTAGYEQFLPYLPEGVVLCNASGVHDESTAELALALILSSGRGLDLYARQQSSQTWQPRFGTALVDKQVLIIGYGNVGKAIESRLKGFGPSRIVRVARSGRDGPPQVHGINELHELLPHADVAILTAPHTRDTEGLISAAELALLPDGALLVNVARGKLVDTMALLNELSTGRLRAALDVVDPEPLPRAHPLWSAPNTVITPHVGGMSTAFAPRADRMVTDQLRRFAHGKELLNVVRGAPK